MPFDHTGQIIEAIDCAACNSSLEWHGRLPESHAEWLCYDCETAALLARAEKAEAEIARLRAALQILADSAHHEECDVDREPERCVCVVAVAERLLEGQAPDHAPKGDKHG